MNDSPLHPASKSTDASASGPPSDHPEASISTRSAETDQETNSSVDDRAAVPDQASSSAPSDDSSSGPSIASSDSSDDTQPASAPNHSALVRTDDPTEPTETSSSETTAEAAAPADTESGPVKPKRKRRRRKKGANAATAGAESAPSDEKKRAKPKKEGVVAPFAHLFEGHTSKRHAFSVGEIVAGRIVRIQDGAVLVDLFGKAKAVVDALEPREIVPTDAETAVQAQPEGETEDVSRTDGIDTSTEASAEGQAATTSSSDPVAATPHETEATQSESAPAPVETATGNTQDNSGAEETSTVASEPGAESTETVGTLAPGQILKGRVGAVSESGHVAIVNRPVNVDAARVRVNTARDDRTRLPGLVYGFNRGGFDVLVEGLRAFCPASGMSLKSIANPEDFVGHKVDFSISPTKQDGKGLVVSRRTLLEKLALKEAKERLKSISVGDRITGKVTQVRDFGLLVDIGGGLEGLVHQSELDYDRSVRPADVAKEGDDIEVQVLAVQPPQTRKEKLERVSLSRKALLPDPWDAHDWLREGIARKGKIVRTAEFGAFVELATGIEGLLHVSELGRDKQAIAAVHVGDEIDVVIERLDRKAHRISLSKLSAAQAKALAEGELDQEPGSRRVLKPGVHVKVKVERVDNYGAHGQVVGVLGKRGRSFIPSNDLGLGRGDARKTVPVGEELEVKVVGIERDGSLRCSRKGLLIDEEKQAVRDYRKEAAKKGFGTFGDILRAKLQGTEEKSE